jgi:peptidoglycan/xylan/chitin deacetylase (PgdA/CDA1 family)
LFDDLYDESKLGPTFCPFQFHPFISSRPGRARALKEIIQYMRKHDGVWFARGSEIAELTLKLAETASKKPVLKEAAGS